MKSFKPYLSMLAGVLLLIFTLQSCMDKAGWRENGQIDSGKRKYFHDLNGKVFKDLKADNLKDLKFYLSKEMIDNEQTEVDAEHVSNALNANTYRLLEEYYAVNKYKDYDTIEASDKGINKHNIVYQGITREMYIAFFVPQSGENKYMITTVYANYNYGWKLSLLDFGPYTINGKTAPELFKLAQTQYAKKYLVNAVNNMALASACASPADIWDYADEQGLTDFYGKILNEVNSAYKFPFILNQVPTKPSILRVYNETNDEGSFPMVYYMTHIGLKNTAAIKKENLQIREVIGKVMPGINKDNKYVFYDAFNKKLNATDAVDHFDMVDTIK